MRFPKPVMLNLGGINIASYQCGDRYAPPVLCVHGWPEMAYSWAHQLPAIANAGYRAIAMDVRGFGHSDFPADIEAYRIDKLIGDIEGVLDALEIREVVLVGHDWGGIMVWHAARMIEERVRGVISICTPHMKRPPADPIDIFRARHGHEHYFVKFTEDDKVEDVFDRDPMVVFKMLFRKTPVGTQLTSDMYYLPKNLGIYQVAGVPDLPGQVMNERDLHVYAGAYMRTGFRGGINLYRNTSANYNLTTNLSDDIAQPSLMISAKNDLFLPPEMADPMVDMVADLERVTIDECGHWAMWEKPDEINTVLVEWLNRKMGHRFY